MWVKVKKMWLDFVEFKVKGRSSDSSNVTKKCTYTSKVISVWMYLNTGKITKTKRDRLLKHCWKKAEYLMLQLEKLEVDKEPSPDVRQHKPSSSRGRRCSVSGIPQQLDSFRLVFHHCEPSGLVECSGRNFLKTRTISSPRLRTASEAVSTFGIRGRLFPRPK